MRDRLRQAVTDGRLTQAEADAKLEDLASEVRALVQRSGFPGPGFGPGRRRFGGPGFGAARDRLDAAVKAGRLTRAEADRLAADLRAHVDEEIQETGFGPHPRVP